MAYGVAPFETTLTHLRGKLMVVSRDGESYRFSPAQLRQMLAFFDLMLAWAEPRKPHPVDVGPFRCTPTGDCKIELPFETATGEAIMVPVAGDWLERMHPVFERCLAVLDGSSDPLPDFMLELGIDGNIVQLPPDRTTLRPA